MEKRDEKDGELTHVGSVVTDLLKNVAGLPIPRKPKSSRKTSGPTRTQIAQTEALLAIKAAPDAAERAYMARQFLQCTLPHSDPCIQRVRVEGGGWKNVPVEVPRWLRRDGDFALVLQPGWDHVEDKSVGYPYGTIPRLLLFWIITEAVKKKKRRLQLGRSLADFMRLLDLDPSRGGKRSDRKRIQNQIRRLLRCRITFQATREHSSGARGEAVKDMTVAPENELWWHPDPHQGALFESWLELGEKFYEAIIASPVPIDMRVLKALKGSALALDLYAWASYRAFTIVKNNQPAKFISWKQLMQQLGADYETVNDFQKKAIKIFRKIEAFYPGLSINSVKGGFTIYATRLAVPQKTAKLQ